MSESGTGHQTGGQRAVEGEFTLLERIRAQLPGPPAGETWIGDDAAVVAAPAGPWQLLAADAVVAGVHADLGLTGLDDLGWKAVVANLSDLAAMGGRPAHALVTVVSPAGTDLELLYRGVAAAAAVYRLAIVGGDLSAGPVTMVSVAVTGTCGRPPVLRSGAGVGDWIWVTGALGAAAAGLRVLRGGDAGEGDPAVLRAAHARPVPLLEEGAAAAAAGATAMIDVSDGLGADLGHLADASAAGFALDAVPVAAGATLDEALGGGEDYQLVFTAPPEADIAGAFARLRQPVRIGTILAGTDRRWLGGRPLPPAGWSHRF